MKLLNKKGDVFQIFTLIVILFLVALFALLFGKMALTFIGFYQTSGILNDSKTATDINNSLAVTVPNGFDELVFFLFLGGNIMLIISAVRTNFSPTVIFIFILLMLISILIASGFVNIYQGFAQTDTMTDTANQLTLTSIIFSKYFPLFICIISAVILIVMYGKSGSEIQA